MNMPYALEWEKDAMKHLLVAEFEHRKRMALGELVKQASTCNGGPFSGCVDGEKFDLEVRRRPPRNILQWYGE